MPLGCCAWHADGCLNASNWGYERLQKSKGSLKAYFENVNKNTYTSYASVTFALRRVYDARTMSKSPFPCGLRRVTLRSSYGFTGIVAYTILFNSAQ